MSAIYSSYSVIVMDQTQGSLLAIPCSGESVADMVKHNLFTLFPHASITVKRYKALKKSQNADDCTHVSDAIMASAQAAKIMPFVAPVSCIIEPAEITETIKAELEEELEKDLFDL